MIARDIPDEYAYRLTERLALLGFFSEADTPMFVVSRVKREIHEEIKGRWPNAYAEAVETGRMTP